MANTITPIQLSNLLNSQNSISPNLWDKFFQTFYTEEIIQREIERMRGDRDEAFKNLFQLFINTNTHLYIISEETGEILQIINLHNYNGEPLNEALLLTNAVMLDGERIRRNEGKVREVVLSENASISGVFSDRKAQTFSRNGVRIHKPGFESLWSRYSGLKTVEFVDMATGKVTDEFYGYGNDFNQWFLAKAARKEMFAVMAYDISENRWFNVTEVKSAGIDNVVFHNIKRDENYFWNVAA